MVIKAGLAYHLNKFVDLIIQKNPLQKKAIKLFLQSQDEEFWIRSDEYCSNMFVLLEREDITLEYVADSYLKMCKDMLKEQVKFKKTGKYSCSTIEEANRKVYYSENEMKPYMYGLGLSQFLWPNHYAMYSYFINIVRKINNIEFYLEIGPGHGLFLVEALKHFENASFSAVDISPISIDITKKVIDQFVPCVKCDFLHKDVREFSGNQYDMIVMCEVLEHLEDPNEILQKIRELLSPGGTAFITTCANAPAIDHVYLYRSVEHIRSEIRNSGFGIISEIVLPVGNIHEDEWEQQKVEINYAALLEIR